MTTSQKHRAAGPLIRSAYFAINFLSYPISVFSCLFFVVLSLFFIPSVSFWREFALIISCSLLGMSFSASVFNTKIKAVQKVLNDPAARSSMSSDLTALDQLLASMNQKLETLLKSLEEVGGGSQELIERYETLTENIAAAIVVREREGKVVYCSPFTEVLTGYPLKKIYQSELDFFIAIAHPEDREAYIKASSVSALGEAFQFRYRIFHQSGIEIWVETRTVPLLDQEGEVYSTISVTLDVTATVRYQKQVEEKNRDLEDFAYMVSHDLKAPVYTIKGMVNMLRQTSQGKLANNPSDSSQDEFVEHIISAITRLEELINGVLEYSRINSKQLSYESLKPDELINDVLGDYRDLITKLKAKIEIDGNFPVIEGDRVKLYQIFSNLIGNALKYSSPERKPSIKVSAQVGPSSQYRHTSELSISFKDNGIGIPPDRLDVIFRPFQRAHNDPAVPGSGIGLACVKKLVDSLNGRVFVESQEGEGSTFTVVLRV